MKSFSSYFHFPTSHTTVHAVRHTPVSCFYTSRRVASCFQLSLQNASPLFYSRIPSYHVNKEYLFGHLPTKDSQGSNHWLLRCTILSFPIGKPVPWVLRPLLTSHDRFYSIMIHQKHHLCHAFVRPHRIKTICFHLIPSSFTPIFIYANRSE